MDTTDSSSIKPGGGGGGGGDGDGGGGGDGFKSSQPQLPPGFRFHPTDEELVVHYLKRKAQSAPLPLSIIADVDLYKFDPWELPDKAVFGEQEWYFFSPRDRKYPNGARPNRAATSGYWKATGTDKPVLTSSGTQKIGVKKALVFYGGKPPRGIKTDWIMHEYRLADHNSNRSINTYINKPLRGCDQGSSNLRLDDWVLCRIYKKNTQQQQQHQQQIMRPMDPFCSIMNHSITSNPTILSTGFTTNPLYNLQSLPHLFGNNDYYTNSSSSMTTTGVAFSPSLLSSSMPLKRTLPSPYWDDSHSLQSNYQIMGMTDHHHDMNSSPPPWPISTSSSSKRVLQSSSTNSIEAEEEEEEVEEDPTNISVSASMAACLVGPHHDSGESTTFAQHQVETGVVQPMLGEGTAQQPYDHQQQQLSGLNWY